MNKGIFGIISGAAFLMATSSIGPGFITQTAYFTEIHKSAFAFAIITSIIIDIIIQLNIWQILSISKLRAQDLANKIIPYSGYLISLMIIIGGFTFNIANIGGAALGINVLFGSNFFAGAIISSLIAVTIFLKKQIGDILDKFTSTLGIVMLIMIFYVLFKTQPPVMHTFQEIITPSEINFLTILTIVGGTVGGYISFSGAHRIIDANLVGLKYLKTIRLGAFNGIVITGTMRYLLFLAFLGVIVTGFTLDPENPPASAFKFSMGKLGYKIFGIILWCASITSIAGSAYTSISFVKTYSKKILTYENYFIIAFILISLLVFITIGKPVKLLIFAGSINALILPLSLFIILLSVFKKDILGQYNHSKILTIMGFIVIIFIGWMGIKNFSQVFVILK
jgi:Mn2+/Fe2+ NRAMP family transporter